jgi:hypothetical protein
MVHMLATDYVTGNAIAEGGTNPRKGWFVGAFLPIERGLRHTEICEVKWGVHRDGEEKRTPGTNLMATTLTLLVSGQFQVRLPEIDVVIVLERPGDYVIFGPGTRHHWKSLNDSVVVTVRWPSRAP